MTFIGIDPGKGGAAAAICPDGTTRTVAFSEQGYAKFLRSFQPSSAAVFVEDVHSMPGQGVSSTFAFGRNYGWILGLCYGLGLAVETVSPTAWKRALGVRAPKGSSKAEAKAADVEMATMMFPSADFLVPPRGRKPHDGVADALLIAEYGRRAHLAGSGGKEAV